MGKALRRLMDRKGTHSRQVSPRTMVVAASSYLLELHRFLEKQELDGFEPLNEEFRNLEECLTNLLKGGYGG